MAVYSNSLWNSFHFDDIHHIVENPFIRDIRNTPSFFSHPEMFSGLEGVRMYRPLLMITYVFNYALGGLNLFGYHLFNNLLHAANAILIFLTLFTLQGNSQDGSLISRTHDPARNDIYLTSLIGGLFFGLHTFNTQSVNYISSRSVLLVTFFFLLTFIAYIKAIDGKRRSVSSFYYSAALLLYFLALLSKEIAITLHGILIIYEYFFNCGRSGKQLRVLTGRVLRYHIPFWAISFFYLIIRKLLLSTATINLTVNKFVYNEGESRSVFINILTQMKALVFYIKGFILPTGLSIEHDIVEATGLADPRMLLSLAVIVFVIGLAIFLRGRYSSISFAIIWFFVTILPETVIPLHLIVNEHRAYLPGVGLAFLIAFITNSLAWLQYSNRKRIYMLVIVITILSSNGVGTFVRNQVWKSDESLWRDAALKEKNSHRAHDILGMLYQEAGRLDEAIYEHQMSIAIFNSNEHLISKKTLRYRLAAYNNLGLAFFKKGLLDEAEREFKNALELDPAFMDARIHLGLVYANQGLYSQAEKIYTGVINDNPDDARTYINLGTLYSKAGHIDKAHATFLEALKYARTPSEFKAAYRNLGGTFGKKGMLREAIIAFNKCLEFDPDDTDSHFNLGVLYRQRGLLQQARHEFSEVLRINPNDVEARNELEWIVKHR
jgi:tetratricopeptide (TPR) repeat protein